MTFLRINKMYLVIGILTLVIGCGSNNGTSNNVRNIDDAEPVSNNVINKKITLLNDNKIDVHTLGTASQMHIDMKIGDRAKDIYILLSNYNVSSSSPVSINSSSIKLNKILKKDNAVDIERYHKIHAPQNVENFRKVFDTYMYQKPKNITAHKYISSTKRSKDVINGQKLFYLSADQSESTLATSRKITTDIDTVFGSKKLNIWVSNDSFGTRCPKRYCVTQEMIDALSNQFLKSGLDNDIYDWVTNIYGEEWGAHTDASLISDNKEITILLTDIEHDNSENGGVLGFYFPKDNFSKSELSGSNERVMLYIDSVLFAKGNGIWSIDDFWPKEIVSTIAHEFQHMIHFYQKSVLLASGVTDTWINEMLSETTEDLIATKIKHIGSRGVVYTDGSSGNPDNISGRYPLFNRDNRLSLTSWQNDAKNYSTVNSFGAYLVRNFGGAKVLHDIMHSKSSDKQAVVKAVNKSPDGSGKSFNDLLRDWGIAVLLSDQDDLEGLPSYNIGDFISSHYKNSNYEMGSVNFFNYNPLPNVSSAVGNIAGHGNYYYKFGTKLRGNISIDLSLNGNTEVTIIGK